MTDNIYYSGNIKFKFDFLNGEHKEFFVHNNGTDTLFNLLSRLLIRQGVSNQEYPDKICISSKKDGEKDTFGKAIICGKQIVEETKIFLTANIPQNYLPIFGEGDSAYINFVNQTEDKVVVFAYANLSDNILTLLKNSSENQQYRLTVEWTLQFKNVQSN